MTKKAKLLGLDLDDLHVARERVEAILGITLNAYDSEYHGGDYFKASGDDFNAVLQSNFMEDDGEPTEAEFSSETILVFINGNEEAVDSMSSALILGGFKLLRTNTF